MAANTVAIIIGKIVRGFADANAFSEDTARTLKELNLENKHEIVINGLYEGDR